VIRQTKTIQISTYNYNLLAESIHPPNFFTKCSKQVNSLNFIPTKPSRYTVVFKDGKILKKRVSTLPY